MNCRQNCINGTPPYPQSVFESVRMGIWLWDVVTNAVRCSLWLARILDRPIEALGNDMPSMRAHVYAPDLAKVKRHMDNCLCDDSGWHEEIFRVVKKSGDLVWIRELCTVTERLDNGMPLLVSGILHNAVSAETDRSAPTARSEGRTSPCRYR